MARLQPGTAEPSKASSWKEGDPCVQNTKNDIDVELKSGRHPPGAELLSATYFLPAGASAEVVLKEPFKAGTQYFGYIERLDEEKTRALLGRGLVTASQVPDDHSLVKRAG
jgi:hypothetical protein